MLKKLLCACFGHVFSDWQYVSDNRCEQIRICIRDGFSERRSIPHNFGPWVYLHENSCERKRECLRDGFIEHQIAPDHFGCGHANLKQCPRCGYVYNKADLEHDWVSTATRTEPAGANYYKGAYIEVDREYVTYTCSKCRTTKEE